MHGTTLKKFDGLVLHTNEQDGNGGEDDAAALPEDHEGGPEDGYGGEEDAAASDDRGAASEDSDDDYVPWTERAVQLLAIRANFPICAINGYDWQQGLQIYYRPWAWVTRPEQPDPTRPKKTRPDPTRATWRVGAGRIF